MKIAIVGGTGRVARRIIAEALGRGHTVTAISRDPSMLETRSPPYSQGMTSS